MGRVPELLEQAQMGPGLGPKWAQGQVGLGPGLLGPGPKWARDLNPNGAGAWDQMGLGCGPKWAPDPDPNGAHLNSA